jgi:hypothetical protein
MRWAAVFFAKIKDLFLSPERGVERRNGTFADS